MKRVTSAVLPLLLIVGAPVLVHGEAAPATVTVTGEGVVRVPPDVARVNVGVTHRAATVSEALNSNREAMNSVLKALRGAGVAPQDISTSSFSIRLEHDREPRQGAPGTPAPLHRVSNMARVTVRDLDQIDAVLEAATAAGANELWGLQFEVDQPDSAAQEATRQAAAAARRRAAELARLHDAALGPVVQITEGGQAGPVMRAVHELSGGGPIVPGDQEVRVHLRVEYALEVH